MSGKNFNQIDLHHVGGALQTQASGHIIFVHGLDGKGFDTWAANNNDDSTFWPKWVAEAFPGRAVWTYAYDAASTFWRGKPEALAPVAKKFLQHLEIKGLTNRPIIFVAHSLGGLVCKTLFRLLADQNHQSYPNFRAIAFFGTPQLGSPLATQLNTKSDGLAGFVARKSPLAEVLDFSKRELIDLNNWFRNQWPPRPVRVYVEVEPMQKLGGAIDVGLVVSEGTADPGLPGLLAYPIEADHSSMVKFSSREDINFKHTLAFIRESFEWIPAAQIAALPPAKPIKIFSVPFATLGEKFIGREADLLRLHEAVSELNGTTAIMQTVTGLGGQGKTQLAVEYAHRYAAQYDAVFWLNAETPESLERGLAALCSASALRLPESAEKEQSTQVRAAQRWLKEHENWLVIADNANSTEARKSVQALLGTLPGKVLITTRPPPMPGNVRQFPLETLSLEAAMEMLRTYSSAGRKQTESDQADCGQLAAALERHALSLRIAAAYIQQRNLSFAQYLAAWNATSTQGALVQWRGHESDTGYERSTAVTFALTLDALPKDARALLDCLAYLAPEPLPDSLWLVPLPGLPLDFGRDIFDCRGTLSRFGLLQRIEEHYYLHRVARAAVRTTVAKSESNSVCLMLLNWLWNAVSNVANDLTFNANKSALASHAHTVLSTFDASFHVCPAANWAELLGWQVNYLRRSGAVHLAKSAIDRTLKQLASVPGGTRLPKEILLKIHFLNGDLCLEIGSFDDALCAFLLVKQYLKALPSLDLRLLVSVYASLGHTRRMLGKLEGAEREFLLGLEIERSENCPEMAKSCALRNNYSGLLEQLGRFHEAEALMREVFRLHAVQSVPEEVQHVNLVCFSRLLIRRDDASQSKKADCLAEAESLLRTANEISERHFHKNDARRDDAQRNLMELRLCQRRWSAAWEIGKGELSRLVDLYGNHHLAVANIRYSIACALVMLNKDNDALTELNAAELIYRTDPRVVVTSLAPCLHLKASVLRRLGNVLGAEGTF